MKRSYSFTKHTYEMKYYWKFPKNDIFCHHKTILPLAFEVCNTFYIINSQSMPPQLSQHVSYLQDYHVYAMWRSLFSWIRLRAFAGAAKLLFIWRRKEYRDRNPTRRWYQKKGWGCSLVLPWCNRFSVRFKTFCIPRYSFGGFYNSYPYLNLFKCYYFQLLGMSWSMALYWYIQQNEEHPFPT